VALLRPVVPTLLSYVLSFIYLGIYWNNHHHMVQMVDRVNGKILWANLHLLFWLSLVPYITNWTGQNHFAPVPTALYGVALLMSGWAYKILQVTIIHHQGQDSKLAAAIGRSDWKGNISLACYAIAIPVALFVHPWISAGLYALVALIWLVPDRRIEKRL
jgi:uncharacterized membrane protein